MAGPIEKKGSGQRGSGAGTTKPRQKHKTRKSASSASPTREPSADYEPFAVNANDIEGLDADQFRRFMRELLRNEVAACGPDVAQLIDNPGAGNDEGEDSETQRSSMGSSQETFVPLGSTIWQYKAEKKKPTPGEMEREVTKKRPKEVLKAGGSYRFVAQQPRGKDTTIEVALKKIAQRKRLPARKVGFHAQAALAERARLYPALARLDFFRKPLDGVQSFEWWAKYHEDTDFDLQSRAEPLQKLMDFLKAAPRPAHLRVVGPAGVGKSRLVLQALTELGIGASTVYAPNATAPSFNSFFKWCSENKARVVLAVDECDEATASRLRGDIVAHNLPIALITINKIEDSKITSGARDLRVPLDPMTEQDIIRILQASTKLDNGQIFAISKLVRGFVKLARVVGEAVERDRTGAFDPAGLVAVDKIRVAVQSLLGVPDPALRWFGVVAMFSEVEVSSSADESDLARLAKFADVSVSDARNWNARATALQVMSDRGGKVFITPALLAVLLARNVIDERRHDLGTFLQGLPPRLQEAFASQLGQLRFSDEGLALARQLIGTNGPFGDLLAERQPWARESFLALGSAARDDALSRLEAWLGEVETAPLELARDSTMERLLFRLIWRPEHFRRAFRLLLAGLSTLTDPVHSGLHRVMAGSLQVILANSKAPYPERFDVATMAIRDESVPVEVRRLILRALAEGVGEGTGDGYAPEDVDREGRAYWDPGTNEAWSECTRAVVRLLLDMLSHPELVLRKEAAADLIDHADVFIRHDAYEPLLASIPSILAIDPRVGAIREEFDRAIAYDTVPEKVDKAIRSAIASLPQDLSTSIRVLVEGWPLFQDREDRRLPERPAPEAVAAEIMASVAPATYINMLFEPWARNPGDLLIALAKRPDAIRAWPMILSAAAMHHQTWGAALFIVAANEARNRAFVRTANDLLVSKDDFEMSVGAEAITRTSAEDDDIKELANAVRAGRVRPSALRYAITGRWAERRGMSVLADLIRSIATQPDGTTMALSIAHASEANLGLDDAEVVDLLARSIFSVRGHDAWTWQQVGFRIAKRVPAMLSVSLMAAIAVHARQSGTRYSIWQMDEIAAVLDVCIDAEPALANDLLALWHDAPRFVEAEGGAALLKHLDPKALGDWATDARRQKALAQFVVPGAAATTEALLIRFGVDSPFASALRERLYPRSWSGSLASHVRSRAAHLRASASDASRSREFREWANTAARWLDDVAERARAYDD